MDPGNWATDLAGGSQFGYSLIWVLLMSNLMALLLQSLSARLGIVRGRDLAQAKPRNVPLRHQFLFVYTGRSSHCSYRFGRSFRDGPSAFSCLPAFPLLWAVLITLLDTFLLLLLQRLGMRKMEAFIICLVAIIGVSFLIEIILAKPNLAEVATGFIPSIPNNQALYIAIGIIGATVMPTQYLPAFGPGANP
jgi:manganese transport protein